MTILLWHNCAYLSKEGMVYFFMITVNGTKLNFDITSPDCLKRYLSALQKLNSNKTEKTVKQNCNTIEEYTQLLEGECKAVTNFIDEIFGDGTCNALLGSEASLLQLFNVCESIAQQIQNQTSNATQKFTMYKPNRKTIQVKKKA